MRDMFILGLKLCILCIIAGALLGITNAVTEDPIEEQIRIESEQARIAAMPAASSFEQVDLEQIKDTAEWKDEFNNITECHAGLKDGEIVGYTVSVNSTGYGGTMPITVGITIDGEITGISVSSGNETPGLGVKASGESFTSQFIGKSGTLSVKKGGGAGASEINALSGATITTRGAVDGVNVVSDFISCLQ